jgi:hypothetical protein
MPKNISTENKCIYCGNAGEEIVFTREHVMPGLLGTFENNLTLVGCVCHDCNSNKFGPLEANFKEDTEEGLFCQMVNFSKSHQIRIRGKKLKMSVELNLGESFFNETFPFLSVERGNRNIVFVPQIKVRGYHGTGYIILLVDEVKKLKRDGQKFKKLKNILNGVESKNVSIFVHGDGDDPEQPELNEAIELVRELGVPYKPGTQKSVPFGEPAETQRHADFSMDGTIDSDTARILAKIAFNYFAYCAIHSNNGAVLEHPNFSKIKSYILGTLNLPLKEIIIEKPSYSGILGEEQAEKIRLIGHLVTFNNENGRIISKVSLLGRLTYTISLGQTPEELSTEDFGNGHIFDPLSKKIHGLTRNPARRGTETELNFALFNGL